MFFFPKKRGTWYLNQKEMLLRKATFTLNLSLSNIFLQKACRDLWAYAKECCRDIYQPFYFLLMTFCSWPRSYDVSIFFHYGFSETDTHSFYEQALRPYWLLVDSSKKSAAIISLSISQHAHHGSGSLCYNWVQLMIAVLPWQVTKHLLELWENANHHR